MLVSLASVLQAHNGAGTPGMAEHHPCNKPRSCISAVPLDTAVTIVCCGCVLQALLVLAQRSPILQLLHA